MNKEEKREMKERLEALRVYLKLSQEAIIECQVNEVISSKKWFRYYGLYCAGKDIQADTRALGQELLNKTQSLKASLGYGIELIESSSMLITKDLSQETSLEETSSRQM